MVFEYLADYIAQNFDIDKEDITAETTFEELRLESENLVDLLFEMSREFDIIADEEDLFGIEDVGSLAQRIQELIESEDR